MSDSELLTSMSVEELEALADCRLAPSTQIRLDHLLEQTDQLTILKTRARYTLSRNSVVATVTVQVVD